MAIAGAAVTGFLGMPVGGIGGATRMAGPAGWAWSARPGTSPARGCRTEVGGEVARRNGPGEVITVEAAEVGSTTGTILLWQRVRDCFVEVGPPEVARVGRNGLSRGHQEGDGTTPIGTYRIGPVLYGALANPGTRYRFHRLSCGDWWDEDPGSAKYNRFVHLPCGVAPLFGGDSEALWTVRPAYDYFAVVDYNMSPAVPGRGSGIFLHVSTGEPTDGCVSVALPVLVRTLDWLRPRDRPVIVIGVGGALGVLDRRPGTGAPA